MGLPKSAREPGLIKTLKQAGLDDRGDVHAPLAHEPEKMLLGLPGGMEEVVPRGLRRPMPTATTRLFMVN